MYTTRKIHPDRTTILLLCLVYFTISAWSPASSVTKDYSVHTLFIFNFMKYAEWPTKVGEFKIGIVDNKEAEMAITKMAKAKSNAAQSITVSNTADESLLGQCQIVFIPENQSNKAEKIIAGLKSKPTLVITEEAGLIKKGAAISFKIVDSKLKFQVNEEVLKANGLRLSSAILTLAEK